MYHEISNKYFWFVPKKRTIALISQGKTQIEVKEKFMKKIIKNENVINEKFLLKDVITAKIIKNKKPNALEPGHIGIAVKFKKINILGKIMNIEDIRTNVVWFSKEYILEHGFHAKNIIDLLTAIYLNKITLPKLGIHLFNELKCT